jgi:hypothetical protein
MLRTVPSDLCVCRIPESAASHKKTACGIIAGTAKELSGFLLMG